MCVSFWQSELQRDLEHTNSMQVGLFLFLHQKQSFRFHIRSAPDSPEFRYTLLIQLTLFFQIPTGMENGYSYSGNPASSMSGVSIVSFEKAVDLFILFYTLRR